MICVLYMATTRLIKVNPTESYRPSYINSPPRLANVLVINSLTPNDVSRPDFIFYF